jgi:hypothetical protein
LKPEDAGNQSPYGKPAKNTEIVEGALPHQRQPSLSYQSLRRFSIPNRLSANALTQGAETA